MLNFFKRVFKSRRNHGPSASKPNRSQVGNCPATKLHDLPENVVQRIAAYLRPEERVLFALVNKTIYNILKADAKIFDLEPNDKYSMLLYLSKDKSPRRLTMVLCHWCRKFHSPVPTLEWSLQWATPSSPPNYTDASRACEMASKSGTPTLPWLLHYNMVKSAMLRHANYPGSVPPPRPSHMDSESTIDRNGIKILIRHRYHVSLDGKSLLLKTERLIHLVNRQNESAVMDSIAKLTALMYQNRATAWEVGHICPHEWWIANYPETFEDREARKKCQEANDETPQSRARRWSAKPDTNLNGSPGRKFERTDVDHCPYCHTYHNVSFVPIFRTVTASSTNARAPFRREAAFSHHGNVCVLTTWKNLGSGQSPNDVHWLTHVLPAKEVFERPLLPRWSAEKVALRHIERPGKTLARVAYLHMYRPLIDDKTLFGLVD